MLEKGSKLVCYNEDCGYVMNKSDIPKEDSVSEGAAVSNGAAVSDGAAVSGGASVSGEAAVSDGASIRRDIRAPQEGSLTISRSNYHQRGFEK